MGPLHVERGCASAHFRQPRVANLHTRIESPEGHASARLVEPAHVDAGIEAQERMRLAVRRLHVAVLNEVQRFGADPRKRLYEQSRGEKGLVEGHPERWIGAERRIEPQLRARADLVECEI